MSVPQLDPTLPRLNRYKVIGQRRFEELRIGTLFVTFQPRPFFGSDASRKPGSINVPDAIVDFSSAKLAPEIDDQNRKVQAAMPSCAN